MFRLIFAAGGALGGFGMPYLVFNEPSTTLCAVVAVVFFMGIWNLGSD
jgi:hypothetical protein